MSKKIKYLLSIVSMILCVTIVSSIPVQALSETIGNDEKSTSHSSFDDVQEEADEIGNIVAEDTSARTETTKKFLLDNGTTMIAEYAQPVHYQNDNGKWVEYNNSLKAKNSTATTDEVLAEEYTNKSSDIDIKLSNKAKSNNMVKVSSADYSISWGYDNANKSKAKIIKDDTKLSGNDKFTTLKNLTSETLYEDVFKNVDLQYFVTSTGVKENIILKSSDVQNEFNLTYKIKNLTAKQTDDYTITLYNKSSKEVYRIVAPYMIDAKGETSTQLKLSIESQKGSNLNVKLTTDYWFIHSIGRNFPITIDPEITLKTKSSLNEAYKSGYLMNHGPYYIGNDAFTTVKVNSLQSLGSGEKIISAKYNFNIKNNDTLFNNAEDNAIIVNAHKMTQYNSTVSYDSQVIDYDSLTFADNGSLTFDLTKLYSEWYDNGESVDGFILEAWDTIGSKQVTIDDSPSAYPSLTIVYKDFTGMESNLAYHTVDAGHNATVSVSDYLGNLVISQSLLEETGSRMPLSITATYNSINYNTIFSNGSPSGYGWQFSFNQYVREVTDTNLKKAGYNYIYTDSDGTDHYLKKSDSKDEWYDEDGIGFTLTVDDNGIYIDNGSVKQTYGLPTDGGKLLSEKDEYNNTITYTYTDGNVTSITDGSGRVTSLSYNTKSNGEKRVSKITRPDGKNIIFSYTDSEFDKIHYLYLADDKVSRFFYDNSGLLTTIEHGYFDNGTYKKSDTVKFTYSNGQVTKVAEYGSNNTEGNYLNIAYGNDNTTVFTDRKGRSETHTFNNNGETVSVLNANGYLSSGGSSLSVSGGAESFTKNYITESTQQSEIKNNGYYFKSNGDRNGVTSSGGTAVIDTSATSEENGQV